MLLPLALALPLVHAQDTPPDAPASSPAGGGSSRTMLIEPALRLRFLSIPQSLMDVWYFDSDDDGALPFDRPKVKATAFGLETTLDQNPTTWTLYVEYVKAGIDEGYWDDVESPAMHEDGDWIEPNKLGMTVLGGNFGRVINITPPEEDVAVGMRASFGLGVGFTKGTIIQWHPGQNTDNTDPTCLPSSPATLRKDECADDGEKRIPGVLPMLDLTVGPQVLVKQRVTARIDLGVHDMLYWGFAVGGAI